MWQQSRMVKPSRLIKEASLPVCLRHPARPPCIRLAQTWAGNPSLLLLLKYAWNLICRSTSHLRDERVQIREKSAYLLYTSGSGCDRCECRVWFDQPDVIIIFYFFGHFIYFSSLCNQYEDLLSSTPPSHIINIHAFISMRLAPELVQSEGHANVTTQCKHCF